MRKNTANQDIRTAATNAGVKLWQIADKLGMNDGNFCRKLRKELTDGEKSEIVKIIRNISEQEG